MLATPVPFIFAVVAPAAFVSVAVNVTMDPTVRTYPVDATTFAFAVPPSVPTYTEDVGQGDPVDPIFPVVHTAHPSEGTPEEVAKVPPDPVKAPYVCGVAPPPEDNKGCPAVPAVVGSVTAYGAKLDGSTLRLTVPVPNDEDNTIDLNRAMFVEKVVPSNKRSELDMNVLNPFA